MSEIGKELFIILYDYDGWSQDAGADFPSEAEANQYIDSHKNEWNEYRLVKGVILDHHNVTAEWLKKEHPKIYSKIISKNISERGK